MRKVHSFKPVFAPLVTTFTARCCLSYSVSDYSKYFAFITRCGQGWRVFETSPGLLPVDLSWSVLGLWWLSALVRSNRYFYYFVYDAGLTQAQTQPVTEIT